MLSIQLQLSLVEATTSLLFFKRVPKLCLEMTLLQLSMQLELTLTEFLLKILCSGLDGGKCLSIRFRKFLPTFVLTFLLKGVLR